MSLHSPPDYPIPAATRRVAHAAFPDGNLCIRLADELGNLDRDDPFADLFPNRGQPALAPARLALASVLQDVEGLSDRPAAGPSAAPDCGPRRPRSSPLESDHARPYS